MVPRARWIAAFALLLGATGAGSTAQAQQQGQAPERQGGLETLTVTARKLEENLQDTPVAVTALGADQIKRSSFQTVQDVALKVPGLRWEPVPTQGNTPTISLRGMSQNDSIPTLEGAVGVYFDGVFMGKLQGGQANLMDIERIEVLKGPQGTLYGKNTLGGALNVVAKRPDGSTGGYGRFTLGNYNRRDFEGAVQFPILGETLSARVAFQVTHRDGYHDFKKVPRGSMVNAPGWTTLDFSAKSDGDQNRGAFGRVTLRWAPTEWFEANAIGYRLEQNKTIQAPSTLARYDRSLLGNPDFPNAFLTGANTGLFGVDPRVVNPAFSLENLLAREDPWESYSDVHNKDDLDVTGGGLTMDYHLNDSLTLRSVTGHREVGGHRRGDMDGTPYAIWVNDDVYASRQFSEELQLLGSGLLDGKVDLVGGVFFFDEDADDDTRNSFGEVGFVGFPRTELDAQARSWSAYSQGNYAFTDRLRGTLGLRFTDEKRWMRNPFILASPDYGRRVDERFSEWTYTAGLDYQLQDDLLVYAKASNGFRSGGFDGRASFAQAVEPFDTEKLTQYEIGAKSQWLDNRLRVNVASYFSNFENIQLTNLVSVPGCFPPCTVRINAGRAKIYGGELEVAAQPVEGLTFSGGLEINRVDYQSGPLADLPAANVSPYIPPPGSTLQPQNQPQMTFSLSATYEFPATPVGIFAATVDWFHTRHYAGSPTNASYLDVPKHGILNGRVSLLDEKHGLEYALFMRNVLNREYYFSGVDFFESGFNFGTRSWGPPRTFGFEITYNFGSDR